MILGSHQSVAGGPVKALERGVVDGCEAVQIFARPSQQWRARPFTRDEISLFRSEAAALAWPLMAHASYLINPGAPDRVVRVRSLAALEEELVTGEDLGLDAVVLHPGAHLGRGEGWGLEAVAESLGVVLGHTEGVRVKLLLELTAGQGSCLGCRFEQLGYLLRITPGGDRMGVCIDTCHAFAAGYDLSTDDGYDRMMGEVDRTIGMRRVLAFHLNDSRAPRGARVDRHAEIGDGYLGSLPFWRLVNDPRFLGVPGVLETPTGEDGLPSFRRNLERLRALIGAPRPTTPPSPKVRWKGDTGQSSFEFPSS